MVSSIKAITINGAGWSISDTLPLLHCAGVVFGSGVVSWECARAPSARQQVGLKGGMAKLYFHYATMNAGKTTMLLQASYNYP